MPTEAPLSPSGMVWRNRRAAARQTQRVRKQWPGAHFAIRQSAWGNISAWEIAQTNRFNR